jgi:hypothetical protein
MTERVAKLMKNFDEIFTVLTRIIIAEELCVYCRARQPNSKDTAIQIRMSELPAHFRNSQYSENDQHFYMSKQSISSHKFMTLNVWIQGHKARAVINSGCTGNMISPKFVKKVGISRYDRAQKVYLYTFDGNPVKKNNGTIREKTGKISLKIGKYKKRVKFDIITTQGYDITLGLP